MKKETLKVDVSCSHCEQGIKDLFASVVGVKQVEVSLADKTVTITFAEEQITLANIKTMLADYGY